MVEVGGFLQNPELVTSGGKVCIKCSKSRVFIPDTFFFFKAPKRKTIFICVLLCHFYTSPSVSRDHSHSFLFIFSFLVPRLCRRGVDKL